MFLIPLFAEASGCLHLNMALQEACILMDSVLPLHDQRSLVNQLSSAEDDFNSKETQLLITILSTLSKLLDPGSQQVIHSLLSVVELCVVTRGVERTSADGIGIWELWRVCVCVCSAFSCRLDHVKITVLISCHALSCQMPARTMKNKVPSHTPSCIFWCYFWASGVWTTCSPEQGLLVEPGCGVVSTWE